MGWSDAFIDQISGPGPYYPRYTLERLAIPGFDTFGTDVYFSSHNEWGFAQQLTPNGNSYRAGDIELRDWSSRLGELTLGYRSSVDLRRQVARGQLMQCKLGFSGWAVGRYEPIFTGLVSSVDRVGQDWTVTMRSAGSAMLSRLTSSGSETSLFWDLTETEIVGFLGYIPGVTTAFEVGSVTGLAKESGGKYLVFVTGDNGDQYFLEVTAYESTVNGFRLTGLTDGILGTAASNAAVGNKVKLCAYVDDDPISAARKLLLSTGLGTNGQWDTLPANWAAGIPQEAVDDDDCDQTALLVGPSGDTTMRWQVYSSDPVDDGLAWFGSVFNPGGIFLSERQGRLTVRAAVDINDLSSSQSSPPTAAIVTDADLVSIDRYETWDSAAAVEYGRVSYRPIGPSGTVAYSRTEQIDSKPSVEVIPHPMEYIGTNPSSWGISLLDRLANWYQRIPEILEITCRGWRLAQLAPGDVVMVDSRYFLSRTGITEARMLVLQVTPAWWGCSVQLRLAHIPTTAAEW